MKRQILNDTLVHFKTLMAATQKELREMQGSPIGTDPRSPQEESALWRKITALPDPEFQGFMDNASMKAGHANDEKEPCSLCRFLIKRVAKSGTA